MLLINQLQNTVNDQFLYDLKKDWWTEDGNAEGEKFPFQNTLASNPTQLGK